MKYPGPYVPLDVNYDSDPAIIAAGEAAEVLFCRSLAYSKRSLSDGFVPAFQLPRFGLRKVTERAASLVREGLWLEVEGGYQFRAWERWNETSEETEQKRQRAAERQRLKREREARDTAASHTDVTRDTAVSHSAVTPLSSKEKNREEQNNHSVGDADASPSRVTREANAGTIVGRWVDGAKAHLGGELPGEDLRARVGKQAKKLLAEGKDPTRLAAAAYSCGLKGYDDLSRELLRSGQGTNGRAAGQDVLDAAQAQLDARGPG